MIKSDQLRDLIERGIDKESAASSLMSMGKFISSETLEDVANQIARLHKPITFDWAAKFGLKGKGASQAPVAEASIAPTSDMKPHVREQETHVDADVHAGRLSTSKLAAKLSVKGTPAMLVRLVSAGYLVEQGDEHVLTERAIAAGAARAEKSRFGPYFLWPESIEV